MKMTSINAGLLTLATLAACSVAALAEEKNPGETLSAITITIAKKTWNLRLSVQPSVHFTLSINGGHDFHQESAVLQLYKEPVSATGSKQNLPPKLVWTDEEPIVSPLPLKTWSGDICGDSKTGQLYLAASDGSSTPSG